MQEFHVRLIGYYLNSILEVAAHTFTQIHILIIHDYKFENDQKMLYQNYVIDLLP